MRCLRDLLERPGVLSDRASLVGVSERSESVLVSFRWMKDVHLFAVEFSLSDAAEGPSTGLPMESPEQWAGEVGWWLMEELDTGFVRRASRRLADDVIVLSRPTWPYDHRFYLESGQPSGIVWPGRVSVLEDEGLDTSLPLRLAAEGRLISWATSHLDAAPGFRIVGHAVVSWLDSLMASVDVCQTLPGAPSSVSLALVHAAMHDAASAGAERVVTRVAVPHLDLLGFRPSADGSSVVDTGFWDEDLEGAQTLLHRTRTEPIPRSWTAPPGPRERWVTLPSHEPPSTSVNTQDG